MSKHYEWSPLVRIYWTEMPQAELCIEGITEVVNSVYQNAVPYLVDPCATVSGVGGILASVSLQVSPNPVRAGEPLLLSFGGGSLDGASVDWLDLTGRIVASERWTGGRQMMIQTADRAPGTYLIQVVQPVTGGQDIVHTRRVTVR